MTKSKFELHEEKDLCKRLKISQRHLVTLRQRGVIPYVALGCSVRYNLDDVKAALKKLTINPAD